MSLLDILLMMAPLLMYISQGPDASSEQDIAAWIEYITSRPAADQGGSNANYNSNAQIIDSYSDSVTKIGPISATYDPELAAWLSAEF